MFRTIFLLVACGVIGTLSIARANDTYAAPLGAWTCTSDAGSNIQQVNTLIDDGKWLSMRVDWTNPRVIAPGYFQNYFFSSPKDGSWNTTSYGSNGWSWAGRSSGWKKDQLAFDGIVFRQLPN